jgi:hypothetical protein
MAAAMADGFNTVFSMGKHSGRTFQDVFAKEKGYVIWAQKLEHASGGSLTRGSGYTALERNHRCTMDLRG